MNSTSRDIARRLDFERMTVLVNERIMALKICAAGLDDTPVSEAICRDLILPNVCLLAQFIKAVEVSVDECEP